jgi:hypothetical protein
MGEAIEIPDVLELYLPHPESRLSLTLTKGSAIVGVPYGTGEVLIHYEGNSFDLEDAPISRASQAGCVALGF